MALEDWITPVSDIIGAWRGGQQPVYNAPLQYGGGAVVSVPTEVPAPGGANGRPAGMYIDKHGHLVHRRRRRRPCISQTDLNLAYQVAQLPNNANVRMFLAKCVH